MAPTRPADALLADLNDPQRAAVVHAGTPLLVVAGAGSGKTRVLTRRIAWLIAERGAEPGQILAITFTNKAAREMKERVAELIGPQARWMWVSTFHSACVRILRREIDRLGFRSNFSIYDTADTKRLLSLVLGDLNADAKKFPPGAVLGWISGKKAELIDPDDLAESDCQGDNAVRAAAYREYQRRLAAADAVDFDDLIGLTVRILQTEPEVRDYYRTRFRHVLVDEYQDTNRAQYALIQLLCAASPDPTVDEAPPAELMVVGDADQSIYAFRGASIRNILAFEQDFPEAVAILLEQNYRSTQTILTTANAVIDRNPDRRPKVLWTAAGPGERIVGYVADDEADEARFVAEEIGRLGRDCGTRPGEVAVFYRTNAQSRAFEEALIRAGRPYRVVGGTRFYERREIRDVLAYLRLLVNPADEISLRRILNTPKRGIGDRAVAGVQVLAENEGLTLWQALRAADRAPGIATRSVKAIGAFVAMMDELRALVDSGEHPNIIVESVLDTSTYLQVLEDSTDPQDQTRVENLAELVGVARDYSENPPPDPDGSEEPVEPDLAGFLERVALVADADQIPDGPEGESAGEVTLMTLHTAKGLEFPVVFLTGLEERVFPHALTLEDLGELAEERRLAYVGITRARERLYVSRALARSAWGAVVRNAPSRFLDDLPVDLIEWRRTAADQSRWERPDWSGRDSAPPRLGRLTEAGRRNFTAAAVRAHAATQGRSEQPIIELTPGDRVTSAKWGLGTVLAVDGQGRNTAATIDFGSAGTKRILLRFGDLTKL